ncbi:MAG TPA: hypothetical protein VI702_01265 [Nitrospiria bacterium]
MIVTMAKIRMVGSKSLLMPVLELLQEMGAVHIESDPPESRRLGGYPLVRRFTHEQETQQAKEGLEALLAEVRRILVMLPAQPGAAPPTQDEPSEDAGSGTLKRLEGRVAPVAARVRTLTSKRKVHEEELSLVIRYEKALKALSPLISRVQESRDLEYMGLVIQSREGGLIRAMEEALGRLTGNRYGIFYEEADEETLAALLVFPRGDLARVKALLWEENIGKLRLPASIMDKPLGEALRIILRKQAELPGKIRKLDRELDELARRWYEPLNRIRQGLENKIARILVSGSFYETRMTFIIYGWIPKKVLPGLAARLKDRFGERVILEPLPVGPGDRERIPVTLSNPALTRAYEVFTRILPLPRYGSIDPTPFIAAFFPLFFGMIIGDLGYGLAILLGSLWLRRKFAGRPMIRNLGVIFTWAAVSSMLWGIAFGEMFGNLGEHWGMRPLLLDRMKDFLPALYLALGLGAAHILLGIVLGIVSAVRNGSRREIVAKFAGMALILSFLVMAGGLLGGLPPAAVPVGLTLMLAGLPVLIIGGGSSAAMQLHNVVNILSYLRLMGIGVASVALAFAANRLGALPGNVFIGAIIALVLHTINLVFGVFSPTIQSLRLHYVEFFENFFEGGGREYRPFTKCT